MEQSYIKIPNIIKIELHKTEKKDLYIKIQGPLGYINIYMPKTLKFFVKNETIYIFSKKQNKIILKTYEKLLTNAIQDLTKPYKKTLILQGTGFSASLSPDKKLLLNLGFSTILHIQIPKNISIQIRNKQKTITIFGKNRNLVTNFAKYVKQKKLPDVYKGQGILYFNEKLNLKSGKQN